MTTQPPSDHVDRGVLSGVLNDYIRNFREILGEAHRLYVNKPVYSTRTPVAQY